jgi:hypothetical protein
MRNFQKCTKLYEELPKMHKIPEELPIRALSMCQIHLVHFWKFLMGCCAILEVLHRIFGSSLWDFLHFWKFLMGFYALFEVNHGKMYTIP